jgi:hypothetical protein
MRLKVIKVLLILSGAALFGIGISEINRLEKQIEGRQ